MKRVAILLSLGVFLAVACEKIVEQEPQVSDVSFTPCQQGELRSNSELLSKVDVEFTNEGVQIKYYNFEVQCNFTTVNITHTFANGVLNIIQQSDGDARCICYTDVSYTISGILQNQVNVVFINGVQVYCYNNNENRADNMLVGKWSVVPSYNSIVEITENTFNFIMGISETWSYKWISNDSIEIGRPDYTTRNEIIFHTRDSVTIKGFWLSDAAIYPPEYYDAILTRIKEEDVNQSNCDTNVIIDAEEYFNVPEFRGSISNLKIEGNNLKFTITASGCSGNSWVAKLIATGAIEKSLPPQRTLQLSFENKEICAAVFSREFLFNIECLQVGGYNKVQLNIAGNSILYEYNEYFKVTVLGKGLDCGNAFVIRFDEEVAGLPDSPVKNHYYADNLPEEHKIEGKNIEIRFRLPKEDEMYACTMMGPTYPYIYT